ncbi:MAG: N-acetylmuramoyl-L-alanine amidase [Bacteroidales bacterium]|jgi:N-acetylmuramoyl-L-alanine amidase|nr:N-acetylmuramoyl-L-alanine amidase [Bacteroidales bacterium]
MQKNKVKIIGAVIGAITLTVTLLFTGKDKPFTNVKYKDRSAIHVLISSGHGSILNSIYQTLGKQSPTWADSLKIYEGYSTKMLALDLSHKLMQNNIDVTYINAYNTDMTLNERVQRVNELYKNDKRVILIDIHHNAQPIGKANYTDFEGYKGFVNSPFGATGIETFTSVGFTESDIINNEFIIPELENDFQFRYGTWTKGKEENFYMLKHSHCPAVLIEFLFMTTYEDCLLIADPEQRDLFTTHITNALVNYNNYLNSKGNE